MKPLEESRFAQALNRMRERLRSAKAVELSRKLSALLAAHEKERSKQRLLAPTSAGDLVLDSNEIEWIEADDYYAAIHSADGHYLIRESLSSLEQRGFAHKVHLSPLRGLTLERVFHPGLTPWATVFRRFAAVFCRN